MSDETKLRFDLPREKPSLTLSVSDDSAPPMDDAEAQMRRALGLDGPMPRPRPEPERQADIAPARSADRFASPHRRRFVQDGEVQVTVLRRGEGGADSVSARQGAGPAGQNRLQRIEQDLLTERTARQTAERAAADAQTAIRDLQTKLGHADLAKNEALDALQRERAAASEARASLSAHETTRRDDEDRVRQIERELSALRAALAEERSARKDLEKALQVAEDARATAERLVRELSVAAPAEPAPQRSRLPAARPRRAVVAVATVDDPEPVQWWLDTPAQKKKR